MRRRLALLPLFLLTAETPVQQPAPAAPPGVQLAESLTFGANGPRMTVPVQIAGAGPYSFIIDTGAQRTIISRQLAGTLGLVRGRNVRVMSMTGPSDVGTVIVPSISVSVIGGERIEAPTLDGDNLGAPGMLGIDTLQGHSLAIDFDRQTMTVAPARKRGERERLLPDEIVVRARSLLGQLVVTDAYVGAQRVRVILDTGSVVTMGNEALRRRIMRRTAPTVPISLLSVTGGSLIADYTMIDHIKVGDLSINNLPIAFADAAPFKAFGLQDKPAILLGMDALKLFRRVDIDFANREVRLALPRDALLSG